MLVKLHRRAEGTGLHVSSYGYKGGGMGKARACTCVGTSFFLFLCADTLKRISD